MPVAAHVPLTSVLTCAWPPVCVWCWCWCWCVSPMQGVKKTKLGLREFVKLGDFQQIIDTQQQQAVSAMHICCATTATGTSSCNSSKPLKPAFFRPETSRGLC